MNADLLFVYGSLRSDLARRRTGNNPGYHMRKLLRLQARLIGAASIRARLYAVTTSYPGVIPGDGPEDIVFGQLYRLNPGLLEKLDVYEGCAQDDPQPWEFRRERTLVTTDDNSAYNAWVYYYNLGIQGKQLIFSGDYCDWIVAKREL